jgi:hypothetical protein
MTELLIGIIIALLTSFFGVGGFFMKLILERMDKMGEDRADMKPKVNALWEHFLTINNKQSDP